MNFLYRKNNALTPELCETFIKLFENSAETQPGVLYGPDGECSTGDKKSTDLILNPSYLNRSEWRDPLLTFINVLSHHASVYVERNMTAFSKLDTIDLYSHFNIQRYKPGEGFSGWHCERASVKYLDRVLVWIVYLNTVYDRGETEFFYQQHFEPAEQGKIVIWPSDWTHLHRGVSSPTETKYILTGWYTHIKQN